MIAMDIGRLDEAMEVTRIRQRKDQRNTWLVSIKEDVKSFGLSQEDAQLEDSQRQLSNSPSPGK